MKTRNQICGESNNLSRQYKYTPVVAATPRTDKVSPSGTAPKELARVDDREEVESEGSTASRSRCCTARCCGCPAWCCCLWFLAIYLLIAYMLRSLVMQLAWPGNLYGDDWSVCTQFTFPGGAGVFLSGCRGLMNSIPIRPVLATTYTAKAPLIMFGGNAFGETGSVSLAGNIFGPQYVGLGHMHPNLEVFATAYRGTSPNNNTGQPFESVIVDDAEALLNYVLSTTVGQRTGGKVLLAAFSLGCAVCLELAARRPEAVAGILLASPWTSLWEMDLRFYHPWSYSFVPWLWVSDMWDSVSHAKAIPVEVPAIVFNPLADEVVPSDMPKRIFDSFRSPEKWLLQTPGALHGDIDMQAKMHEAQIDLWLKAVCARLPSGC